MNTIVKVDCVQDCNHSELYELVVEIDGELPEIHCELIHTTKDGNKLWYGETTDGFVSFYVNGVEAYGHDADYKWSSRSSVFNALGKECMEIVLVERGIRYASAMTLKRVRELLPNGYTISTRHNGNEIIYSITKQQRITPKWPFWG